ncbi:hypothetical protein F0562_008046 [Nyssa sinensis]|uniref:Protodermal factor 1 n=1 Tax=Nyssa sinensis TaxID=561372 RepID=A0A5J5A531_9ASTE|nr:hypothetical protein F0562_008046 [Nyssa sinensis]
MLKHIYTIKRKQVIHLYTLFYLLQVHIRVHRTETHPRHTEEAAMEAHQPRHTEEVAMAAHHRVTVELELHQVEDITTLLLPLLRVVVVVDTTTLRVAALPLQHHLSVTPPPTPFLDPGTPTTPGISIPAPPFDPNSPPFTGTCNFWSSHPGLIWGLLGYWGTMGGVFGVPSIPGFGSNMSLQEALSNTHANGFGALYREGTASLLNSMANRKFPFTTKEVRDSFVRATTTSKAAAAQAHLFKLANEGRLKPRA